MLRDVASRRAVARWLNGWWNTQVDYHGQVEYFAKRSLTGMIQLLVGCAVAVIAVVVVVAQFSAQAPHTPFAQAVAFGFAASLLLVALGWWLGSWPSRWLSRGIIVYLDVGIVVVSVVNITGLAGVFALSALIMVSCYLVFFDGPKILLLHTIWILVAMVLIAITIAAEVHGDAPLIAARALAGAALAFTPVATQFALWVLRSDANEATTDPLTGLLNRRGLSLHINELARHTHREERELAVAILDLDRFKAVNDAFGHAVGDEVLVRSASRLRNAFGGALVARVGGEEFVVVSVVHGDIRLVGETLRTALSVANDHVAVTASVGVVGASPTCFTEAEDPETVLGDLIDQADAAMFAAKRAGGDNVVCGGP